MSVLLGNGNGTFQTALFFAAGNSPEAVAVADLNGDGGPDLVTANFSGNDVSVLLSLPEPDATLGLAACLVTLTLLHRRRPRRGERH